MKGCREAAPSILLKKDGSDLSSDAPCCMEPRRKSRPRLFLKRCETIPISFRKGQPLVSPTWQRHSATRPFCPHHFFDRAFARSCSNLQVPPRRGSGSDFSSQLRSGESLDEKTLPTSRFVRSFRVPSRYPGFL